MQVLLCDVGPRDGLQNEPEVLPPACGPSSSTGSPRPGCAGSRRSASCATTACRRWPTPRRSWRRPARARASSSRASCSTSAAGSGSRPPGSTASTYVRGHRELQPAQRERDACRGRRADRGDPRGGGETPATVTISCSFGCPFEGAVDPGVVADLASRFAGADGGRSRRHDRRRHAVCGALARRAGARGRVPRPQHAQHRLRELPRRARSRARVSTLPSAASAAVPSRRARRATSRPRISSGSSRAKASRRASTSTRSSASRSGSKACSAATLEGYVYRAGSWPPGCATTVTVRRAGRRRLQRAPRSRPRRSRARRGSPACARRGPAVASGGDTLAVGRERRRDGDESPSDWRMPRA